MAYGGDRRAGGVREVGRGSWGGKRIGAGRKQKGPRSRVSHRTRPEVSWKEPVHITLRMADHVWKLRGRRVIRVLERAFFVARDRFDMRVTHLSIQGNHIHLIVEAKDRTALSRGMQGLLVRVAKGLNKLMRRSGKVLADRYHTHVLRHPREARNAIRYVLNNSRIHAERAGREFLETVDRFAAGPGSMGPDAACIAMIVPAKAWLSRQAHPT